jgi:hypothetical protein
MKNKLFAGLFALMAFSTTAFAEKADFFLEETQTESTANFDQLDELEAYVNQHEGITYAEVAADRQDLVVGVSSTPSLESTNRGRPVLGIPSWIWGCVFGVAGLAVVYFVTEDRDETMKALWGCVGSTVVVTVLYIVLFATAASTAATI